MYSGTQLRPSRHKGITLSRKVLVQSWLIFVNSHLSHFSKVVGMDDIR